MEKEQYLARLGDELSNQPGYRDHGIEWSIHCPFCERPDGRATHLHGHFYISKVKNANLVDCKKCEFSGALSLNILDRINLDAGDIVSYVKTNHKIVKVHVINLDERNKRLNFKIPDRIQNIDSNKLDYIESRMMVRFTPEQIVTFKLVLNLKQFLLFNKIQPKDLPKGMLQKVRGLTKDYFGFLSYYGNLIEFRRIDDDDDSIPKTVLFNISDELKKPFLYTPSMAFDPLTESPTIAVAEGKLDIIGIILRFGGVDRVDTIYMATGSIGAFKRTIKHALSISGFYGCTIHMYLDNDKLVSKIKELASLEGLRKVMGAFSNFKVKAFINTKYKDFGRLNKPMSISKRNLF